MLNTIQNASPVLWTSISNGLIVTKASEGEPGAKSRVNKLGTTVWEKFYGSIHGVITSISVEENKFGEQDIKVGLKSNGNDAVLTIKLESSYGRSFLAQIFNVDVTQEILFSPWQKVTEDGTKKSRLYLQYGTKPSRANVPVEYKLPDGTPEVKFVEIKGKKVVDNISQIESVTFLTDKLAQFAKEKGLVYTKTTSEDTFLTGNVDTTPLTEAEKKQLSKPKDSTKAKKSEESDELWDSM